MRDALISQANSVNLTGNITTATFIGFVLFGQYIPEVDRLRLAFELPITMGGIFIVARWLRDGYAP